MNGSLAERASFRDVAGRVVERDGELVRIVSDAFVPMLRATEASGLLRELHDAELLVTHTESDRAGTDGLLLRPERIPFISYPYEWTPRQLRDAALLTLDIAQRALRRGQVLRDASAFNIQFLRGRPILIDSLSFEPRRAGAPWMAYGQFCRHFLAPLALATLADPSLLRLSATQADGVAVADASRILGRRGWLRVGTLVHLHLHALAGRRARAAAADAAARGANVSDRQLEQTFEGLRSTIEALPFPEPRSDWLAYAGGSHYDASSREAKDRFIAAAVERLAPRSLWDLGANRGEYAARHVPAEGYALALDADLACAEAAYALAHQRRLPMVSLWQDLLVPAPASGWANEERASLTERGPADLVLALAIVHHLSVAGRVPLERVVRWLAQVGKRLVIEVPDADDPMVLQLARAQAAMRAPFGRAEFRAAIAPTFAVLDEATLPGLPRTMFLVERRGA